MRIRYEKEGGIAYFPGLSTAVEIDTEQLPAAERSELERLIEVANFFELPAVSSPPHGAADYRQYKIAVSTPRRSHTVQLADPIKDLRVQDLVRCLEAIAGKRRAARS
jgi:hypothetical protein